jgi:hypothetical protein
LIIWETDISSTSCSSAILFGFFKTPLMRL